MSGATKWNNRSIALTLCSGGSILTELLQSPEASELSISALIRRPEQAARLQSLGVKPLEFKGLDDLDACRDAASQHDGIDSFYIDALTCTHTSL